MNNLSTIQSIVWFPWVVLAGVWVKGRKWWVFPLVVLMQFLAGYPQHVVMSGLLAVLVSFFFNDKNNLKVLAKRWLAVGTLTVFVSGVAWLPFAKTLLQSTRVEQSLEQAGSGSLNPVMMVKVLVPYFFDKPTMGVKWGPAWNGYPNMFMYVTWIGLLLMVVDWIERRGRNRLKFFVGIILGSITFSLGEYLPGFEWLQKNLPMFRVGRSPSMMMVVTTMIVSWWIGAAVERVSHRRMEEYWKRYRYFLIVIGLIASFLFVITIMFPEKVWLGLDNLISGRLVTSNFHTLERDALIMKMVGGSVMVALWSFIASFWLFVREKKWLLLAVIIIDLFYGTQGNYFIASSSVYDWRLDTDRKVAQGILSETGDDYRLLTRNFNRPYTDFVTYWEALTVRRPFSDSFIDEGELESRAVLTRLRSNMTPNWNMAHNIRLLNGYTTLLPTNFGALWQLDSEEARVNYLPYIDPNNPLLDEWSVSHYLVDEWFDTSFEQFPDEGLRIGDRLVMYENEGVLPRIRYSDKSVVVKEDYVENPNTISWSMRNDKESRKLIVADRYDDDWRVWVNDFRVNLENYQGMRSFAIPSGELKIEMKYVPVYFYYGLVMSLVGVVMIFWVKKFGAGLIDSYN